VVRLTEMPLCLLRMTSGPALLVRHPGYHLRSVLCLRRVILTSSLQL
jgi:hypothetical protein